MWTRIIVGSGLVSIGTSGGRPVTGLHGSACTISAVRVRPVDSNNTIYLDLAQYRSVQFCIWSLDIVELGIGHNVIYTVQEEVALWQRAHQQTHVRLLRLLPLSTLITNFIGRGFFWFTSESSFACTSEIYFSTFRSGFKVTHKSNKK